MKTFRNDNSAKRMSLMNNEVFTTTEAGVMMGVSYKTVRKLLSERRLHATRSHTARSKSYITRKDLFDFMDANGIEIFEKNYRDTREQQAMSLLARLVAWSESGNSAKLDIFTIVDKAKVLLSHEKEVVTQ